ncbi:6246_t:CDS:2, partial [Diversispora eburnea]
FNDKESHSVLTYEEALERKISSLIGTFTDALIISSRNVTSAQELQKERQKHLTKAYEYHENDIILLYDSAKRQVHGQKALFFSSSKKFLQIMELQLSETQHARLLELYQSLQLDYTSVNIQMTST